MLSFARIGIRRVFLATLLMLVTGRAVAHGLVGKRLFIEPLVTEDANPKTEFDFPVLEVIQGPNGHHVTFNYSFEKKILPKVSVDFEHNLGWFTPDIPASSTQFGGGNIGLGVKYALYRNLAHEFIMSGKFGAEVPTGDASIGADPYTTLSPEFLYAKGFGDLPSNAGLRWLRPFAVQGDMALNFPAGGPSGQPTARFTPRADLVVEYSIPYLDQFVLHNNHNYSLGDGSFRKGRCLGAIMGDLFPFSEFNFIALPVGPTGRKAFGFFRPGIAYVGHYFEVGGAAEFPANRFTGSHVGGMAIFDLFVDDVFPILGRMLPH